MAATDLYLIRKNQQWVKYSAVEALSLTGATTSDEQKVWSAEFRDIFSSVGQVPMANSQTTQNSTPATYSGPGLLTLGYNLSGFPATVTPTVVTDSDEVAHADLRQTLLSRTFWKFDRGAAATPRYLFAYVQEGDIVADNPPET